SKDYKAFTKALKKVYGAPSLKACLSAFESFKQQWASYSGAIDVWTRNFNHIEQLYDYGSAIRKVMYTTNAVESIHASFRKVTNKGAFPNENALLKVLFLRIKELETKWEGGHIQNWAMVMNQLLLHDELKDRVLKYHE
ncbi:transposase, partial [Pseudogracilibacillus auburnensis]|uniref:transposase n=1 Tax=Pseudogracilibacillus auburnensis TaxID=1494959 RepID=UPI001A971660